MFEPMPYATNEEIAKLKAFAKSWGGYADIEIDAAVDRFWLFYQVARKQRKSLTLDQYLAEEGKRKPPTKLGPSQPK